MTEDPLEKILRVSSSLLRAVSFDGIEFKESRSIEVQKNGGVMTEGDTIHYDPLYVLRAEDTTLAFILAHEHGHWRQEVPNGDDGQAEIDADEHALHKLLESGWNHSETEKCLADYKSLFEWYFEATNQPRPEILDLWATLIQLRCSEIWKMDLDDGSTRLGRGTETSAC